MSASLTDPKVQPVAQRDETDRRMVSKGPPEGVERRMSVADRRVENNVEYVTFYLNNHLIGVPVKIVQEVLPLQKITQIPRAPKEVRGLMNLRGQIVTVVNLRTKLGFSSDESPTRMNVILEHHGELLSLEADSVGDVLPVSKANLLAPPPTLEGVWQKCCDYVVQLPQELLVVLNVEKIFGNIQMDNKKGEN